MNKLALVHRTRTNKLESKPRLPDPDLPVGNTVQYSTEQS